jgi:hypothetical protein
MHTHSPGCLEGPVSRERGCWKFTGEARRPAPVRRHLVERVRAEIASGTYDTPEKLEAALDRLLERMDRP